MYACFSGIFQFSLVLTFPEHSKILLTKKNPIFVENKLIADMN